MFTDLECASFLIISIFSLWLYEDLLKMDSLSGHPRCRWVCFFIRTYLKKFRITSLAHQWMLCSEWVPSEWVSKQLIKTSQQSTSNLHDCSPSVNILWSEKLHVCKKQIYHWGVLTLNHQFWPEYQSIIHNASSSVKVHLLFYSHRHPSTYLFRTVLDFLLLNGTWSVHISLLMTRLLFH